MFPLDESNYCMIRRWKVVIHLGNIIMLFLNRMKIIKRSLKILQLKGNFSNVEIHAIKPGIEDCFMALMETSISYWSNSLLLLAVGINLINKNYERRQSDNSE